MKNYLKLFSYIFSGIIYFSTLLGDEVLARTEHIRVAKYQIEKLEQGLLEFKNDIGYFPTTNEGLISLFENRHGLESWRGPYSNRPYLYIDPWENNYVYYCPAKYGNSEYDLYSMGPNGIDEHGLGDDITN